MRTSSCGSETASIATQPYAEISAGGNSLSAMTEAPSAFARRDHVLEHVRRLGHEVVAEEDREGLVADVVSRDPDRVPEALRLALAHVVDVRQLGDRPHRRHVTVAAGLLEVELELERPVEVVFERPLAPTRDDEDVPDPGPHGLFDDVLDGGLVDERQHLFGLRFRRRQEAGAEPRRRYHRLAHHRATLQREASVAAPGGGSLSTRPCRLLTISGDPNAHLRVPLQGMRPRARGGAVVLRPVAHRVPALRRPPAQGVRVDRHHVQG